MVTLRLQQYLNKRGCPGTAQHAVREGVLQHGVDGAAQGAGAIGRVPAVVDEPHLEARGWGRGKTTGRQLMAFWFVFNKLGCGCLIKGKGGRHIQQVKG